MKIKNIEDIINHFIAGNKNEKNIGIENEKFIFDKNNKNRSNYEKISKVLKYLHKNFGWIKVLENKNLVGLKLNGKQVTLEPGNQIELAGAKLKNVHEACSESFQFQDQLIKACKELNLDLMSVGYDPITKLKDTPSNPKKRYQVMTKEMPKNGKLSLEMMYQTAGTQINLDYSNEKNFSNIFKLVSYLSPLSIALFANSSIKEKVFSQFLSYRSYVWQNTSRGGLPKIFLEDMDFEKYADFSLNYPLLFLIKNSEYLFPKNYTFKDFVENKIIEIDRESPTKKDLETHLSTIFTEIRLKQYLEIRSIDACEWDCHCAAPAFYTGLIYGNLDEALHTLSKWKSDDVLNAYFDAPKKGLKTEIDGKDILNWSKIFLEISRKGLIKRNFVNSKKNNETIYLKNIENILSEKKTKAEKSLKIT